MPKIKQNQKKKSSSSFAALWSEARVRAFTRSTRRRTWKSDDKTGGTSGSLFDDDKMMPLSEANSRRRRASRSQSRQNARPLTPALRLQIDNWTKTESGSIGKTQINRRTIVHSNRHFPRGPNKEEMLRGYDNWRQRRKKKKKMPAADKLSRDGWALADYTDLYLFIKQSAAFKCQRLRIQSEL